MSAQNLSIERLESILQKRRSDAQDLENKRNKLLAQLEIIDNKLTKIKGGSTTKKTKSRSVVRASNDRPLRAFVADALKKEPANLQEITDRVLKAGYKSNSSKFKNVVYQSLFHNEEFVHDAKTGQYSYKAKKKAVKKKTTKRTTKKKVAKKN